MPHIRDALKQVSVCMELVVPRMHSDEQVPAGLSSDSGPDPVHERETLLQDLGLNTREYEVNRQLFFCRLFGLLIILFLFWNLVDCGITRRP